MQDELTNQPTILVIDDEASIRNVAKAYLEHAGYRVLCATTGPEGLQMALDHQPDLIVLDLMLPGMDGMEITARLRERSDVYILMLTARSDEMDRVAGLRVGADDYLTKPFNKDELIARITAIVRRSKGHAESVIRTGEIVVNLDAKTVEVGGERVHLTGKEYAMFELLSLRKGTTLTKEMFLNHLYGGLEEPELKIIDVFICKLRKKLEQATKTPQNPKGNHYIETVWGRGYVLRDPRPNTKANELGEAA